jgi:hypothetical protein
MAILPHLGERSLPFVLPCLAATLGFATPSAACYPGLDFPFVGTSSQVCLSVFGCSPVYGGYTQEHPAESQQSYEYTYVGVYDFLTAAATTIDYGYFSSEVSSSGSNQFTEFSTAGAQAIGTGEVHECFTVSGSSGTGRLHLPLRITGGTLVSWAITPAGYQIPANVVAPGYVELRIICAQAGALSDCGDPFYRFLTSQGFDEQQELVVDFVFDQTFYFTLSSRLSTTLGLPASGQAGLLTGMVEASVLARFGSAYVTDGAGTLLPNAVIAAGSGSDYRNPVPEPDGTTAGVLALAFVCALCSLGGRRPTPPAA